MEFKFNHEEITFITDKTASNEERAAAALTAAIEYSRSLGVKIEDKHGEALQWATPEKVTRFCGDIENVVQLYCYGYEVRN